MFPTVRQLAAEYIRPQYVAPQRHQAEEVVATFGDARFLAAEALIGARTGLDLQAGERVVAAVRSVERPKGQEHRETFAITDRRTARSVWSSMVGPIALDRTCFSIEHRAIIHAAVKKAGWSESAHVALQTRERSYKLELGLGLATLGPFYENLVHRVPPEGRCEPPTAFVLAGEGDPSGAKHALGSLWFEDPEARRMLQRIDERLSQGLSEELARDLVARVVLAHRTVASVPAMEHGHWLSVLPVQDFGPTLVRLLGMPTRHWRPQPSVEQLTFYLDPRHDVLSAAFASLGVASYLVAGAGVNPAGAVVSLLFSRSPVTHVDVVFFDHGGRTLYSLVCQYGALEMVDSRLATQLHAALAAAAFPVLSRRIERGWEQSNDQILAS